MTKWHPKHAASTSNVAWVCGAPVEAVVKAVVKKEAGSIVGWLAPMGWAVLVGWFAAFASHILPFS